VETDDFLAHYGVKGMKWGVRKSTSGKSRRQLNKESRQKDRAKLDRDIDRARARVNTNRKYALTDKGSKSHSDYKKAKAQYKKDKAELGSREARKILNKAKEKRYKDVQLSNTAKSGRETTIAVLAAVGYIGLQATAQYMVKAGTVR
jgi:hypothetical protein